jgi:uncharacterized protein
MKLPRALEYRIFPIQKDSSLLFYPQGPSLFSIDNLARDILDIGKVLDKDALIKNLSSKYSKKDIEETLNEFVSLEKRGFLKPAEVCFKQPKRTEKIRRLELHLANDCNLACKYCFAKGGDFGLSMGNRRMSWDMAQKTIDWFLKPYKDSQDNLSINFFGGEPLLNAEVLKKSLIYIQKKIDSGDYPFIRLSLSTNGTLLTENIIKILFRHNCIPWISLDASRRAHNKNRVYRDGKGSYDDVVRAIRRLKKVAPRLPIVLCPTFGKNDTFSAMISLQKELKAEQVNFKFEFSMHDKNFLNDEEFYASLERVRKEMTHMYNLCQSKGQPFEILEGRRFYQLHTASSSYMGCGAGKNRVAVSSQGDIYMCSMAIGKTAMLGSIRDGIEPQLQYKVKDLYNTLSERTSECLNCWARALCNKVCVLGKDVAHSKYGLNRVCDVSRLLNEFYLKSYALLDQANVNRIFGVHKNTEKVLRKISLLYYLRDLRNRNLKHIRHISPVVNTIDKSPKPAELIFAT